MMNLFVGTDSRGIQGNNISCVPWTEQFIKTNRDYLTTMRALRECWSFSIYALTCLEKYEDAHFDVAVIPIGVHGGIAHHTVETLQKILGGPPDGNHLSDPATDESKVTRYLYRNPKLEQQSFDLLRRKSKHTIYIGLHCLEKYLPTQYPLRSCNSIRDEIESEYREKVDTFLDLPKDAEWAEQNTFDALHYNERGHEYIYQLVRSSIDRLDS